ncbi:Retrovirus-related Pol polyprotein from transposon 297 [Mytilus coruscus]|uniref:Retrovirus-related Pol polyprotein from transposon 297 n=1 Tax=Mytilus coruscus TaxID=42192 RepID=A0A6J8B819_MYTCO|nr:Retrovirus-related Pol polyprotein from transposon 297 [Mytilus coruscus]
MQAPQNSYLLRSQNTITEEAVIHQPTEATATTSTVTTSTVTTTTASIHPTASTASTASTPAVVQVIREGFRGEIGKTVHNTFPKPTTLEQLRAIAENAEKLEQLAPASSITADTIAAILEAKMQEPLEEIRRLHTSINMTRPNQLQQNKNRYNKPRQNYQQRTVNQQQHAFVPQQHYIPQHPVYNGQQYSQPMPTAVQNPYQQQQQQQQDDGSCRKCVDVGPSTKNKSKHALIDTGAEITCCSVNFYSKLALSDKLSQSDIPSIKGVSEHRLQVLGKVNLPISFKGAVLNYHVYLIDGLHHSFKVGWDVLHENKVNIDFSGSVLQVPDKENADITKVCMIQTTSTGLARTYYPVTISPFCEMNVGVKISKRNSGEIVLLEPKIKLPTKSSSFPIPRLENVFDTLGEVQPQILSCLDLQSGFWQVEVDDETKHKSAFITRNFFRMPFGLKNAPISSQQLMSNVLRGLNWQFVLVYVDDILVFSKSFEEHLSHLEQVFTRLRDANLTLKPSKCVFAAKDVKYLGHIISKEGIKVDPEKTKAISTFPVPTRKKQVRSFLGMCNYYRRFVDSYSKIVTPLNGLLKKERERSFKWNKECQVAFDNLKQALLTPPVLAYPDMNKPFMVTCDASNSAIGFVLGQLDSQRKERVIAFGCKSLSKTEQVWSTTEKECRRSYHEQPDDENEVAAVKVSEVNTGTEVIGKDRTSESIQVEFFYDDYTMVAPLDPVIPRPELSNRPAIANLQQCCPDFGNMYKFLTEGTLTANNDRVQRFIKSAQDYSICNNVLYKWFQKRVRDDNGEKWIKQLCLPQALREDALLSYHDSFVGGAHLGIERVYYTFGLKCTKASKTTSVMWLHLIT